MKIECEQTIEEVQVTRYIVRERHRVNDGEWSGWGDIRITPSRGLAERIVKACETDAVGKLERSLVAAIRQAEQITKHEEQDNA